jgi:hypothetical protein
MKQPIVLALLALACACAGTNEQALITQPAAAAAADLANADRAALLAWKETLGTLYPLTIRGRDTVSALTRLVAPANAQWTANTSKGTPLMAAIYAGDQTAGEIGFIETARGDGGFFVLRQGTGLLARPATDDEIGQFLAFFGIGVAVVE